MDNMIRQFDEIYFYRFLIPAITELERPSLKVSQQLAIIDDVMSKLELSIKSKLKSTLAKNPDLESFRSPNQMDFLNKIRFAPLVSVEAEKRFHF
jgi:hypothetical protein